VITTRTVSIPTIGIHHGNDLLLLICEGNLLQHVFLDKIKRN